MDPVLIGYTNLTGRPDQGAPQNRQKVYLTEDDLVTHLHGVGATRSGKSKWLEWFCRGLVRQNVGFTLLDPQGALSEALIHYLAYARPAQPVIYFNPSRSDRLVLFNPFRNDGAATSVRVSKQVAATLRVWGVADADETPRLERVMRCVYHLFTTGHISLNEVHALLLYGNKALREQAAEHLRAYPKIRDEWLDLTSTSSRRDFNAQVESTRNRLFRFIAAPHILRIMSLEGEGIVMGEVFSRNAILIANLQDSDLFTEENARLVGTLMINEIWSAARRHRGGRVQPYFLLIDEFQKFLTPDIREILDRGAGKGLHLGMFHQHLTQLQAQDQWTYDSVMGNAKTKVAFGGLTHQNALLLVDELFAGQIEYDEVKRVIEQTKFWPKYRRDTIYTSSKGGASGYVSGGGTTTGQAWDYEAGAFVDTETDTKTNSATEQESWQEGESDIPIFYPEAFKETSSITTYTLEEQRRRLADRLMLQYQRHFFVKRPGRDTIPAVTPFVKPFAVFPEMLERYVVEHCIDPHGLPVEEIDRRLRKREAQLLEEALYGEEVPEVQDGQGPPDDFLE